MTTSLVKGVIAWFRVGWRWWVAEFQELGSDYVDWGGGSSRRVNPWVTVDALYVLRRFDRLG